MTRSPIGHHGPTHMADGEDPIPSVGPPLIAYGQTGVATVPSIAGGASALVSFDGAVASSDTAKALWIPSGGNPNVFLEFPAPAQAWVLVQAGCSWPAGTNVDCRIVGSGGHDFLHDGFNSMQGYDADISANQGPTLRDFAIFNFNLGGPMDIGVRLTNADVGASAPYLVDVTFTAFIGLSI